MERQSIGLIHRDLLPQSARLTSRTVPPHQYQYFPPDIRATTSIAAAISTRSTIAPSQCSTRLCQHPAGGSLRVGPRHRIPAVRVIIVGPAVHAVSIQNPHGIPLCFTNREHVARSEVSSTRKSGATTAHREPTTATLPLLPEPEQNHRQNQPKHQG